MSTVEPDLERGHAAYAERSWLEAYEAFARADAVESLAPEDLELRVTTARMLARDDEAVEILERAHHAYLEKGEAARAGGAAGGAPSAGPGAGRPPPPATRGPSLPPRGPPAARRRAAPPRRALS